MCCTDSMNVSDAFSTLSQPIASNFVIGQEVKTHACLMLFAWGFCSPNGILISRHFKKGWPGRTIGSFAYWFQFHIIFQSFLLALVLISFMTIIVHVMGYSTLSSLPYSAHPVLGFAVSLLAFSNPIIAWLLCTSTGRLRTIFKYFHQTIGIICQLVSIPTIFIGLTLPALGEKVHTSRIYSALYIVCTIAFAITEVILEIIGYRIAANTKTLKKIIKSDSQELVAVLNDFAQNPKQIRKRLEDYFPDDAVWVHHFQGEQKLPRELVQNNILWIVNYFLLSGHLAISFALTFILITMLANA